MWHEARYRLAIMFNHVGFKHIGSAIVLSTTIFACGAATDGAAASDQDLTGSTLKYGGRSAIVKATGAPVKYSFTAGANAAVDISIDEAFVTGETPPLVDPPKNVDLIGPDGKAVASATKQVWPGGGQANAGVEIRASNLAAGKYTIVYTGVAPHSYMVSLKGHDGTGINAPCDPGKGVRHNPICGASLRCDGASATDATCSEASKKDEFCNTARGGDDVCADGLVCKYSSARAHGDEGYNGVCSAL
jgi:hypothetical protein